MMNSRFLLRLSPELQRNLWLEFSLPRLVIMPLVIALVLLAANESHNLEIVGKAASVLVWILLVLWGTRLAAESFTDEVQGRTWDTQRLSASSATSLILGKLVGGTAYAWYGAAFCFAAELWLAPDSVGQDIPASILGALIGQASSLFFVISFRFSSSRQAKGNTRVFGAQLLGILMAGTMTSGPVLRLLGTDLFNRHHTYNLQKAPINTDAALPTIDWYGRTFDLGTFHYCLGIVGLVWLIVGAIRLVRRDLGYRDGPAAWLAFTLFMIGLVVGFTPLPSRFVEAGSFRAWLMLPLAVTLTLTYLALLGQPVVPLKLRRLGTRLRQGNFLLLWPEIPGWAVSALFVLAIAVILAVTGKGAVTLISILGFLLRDVILVYGCRLRFIRRSGGVIALLIFLLYWLGPYICHPEQSMRMKNTTLLAFFMPLSFVWYGAIFPWVEAAIALGVFWPALRRAFRIEPAHG